MAFHSAPPPGGGAQEIPYRAVSSAALPRGDEYPQRLASSLGALEGVGWGGAELAGMSEEQLRELQHLELRAGLGRGPVLGAVAGFVDRDPTRELRQAGQAEAPVAPAQQPKLGDSTVTPREGGTLAPGAVASPPPGAAAPGAATPYPPAMPVPLAPARAHPSPSGSGEVPAASAAPPAPPASSAGTSRARSSAGGGGARGSGGTSGSSRGQARAKRGPRPRLFRKNACQADGCTVDLADYSFYYQRNHICPTHLKADRYPVHGVQTRFCQRCGIGHPLDQFIGARRSCQKALIKHNERRRSKSSANTSMSATTAGGGAGSVAGAASHVGSFGGSLGGSFAGSLGGGAASYAGALGDVGRSASFADIGPQARAAASEGALIDDSGAHHGGPELEGLALAGLSGFPGIAPGVAGLDGTVDLYSFLPPALLEGATGLWGPLGHPWHQLGATGLLGTTGPHEPPLMGGGASLHGAQARLGGSGGGDGGGGDGGGGSGDAGGLQAFLGGGRGNGGPVSPLPLGGGDPHLPSPADGGSLHGHMPMLSPRPPIQPAGPGPADSDVGQHGAPSHVSANPAPIPTTLPIPPHGASWVFVPRYEAVTSGSGQMGRAGPATSEGREDGEADAAGHQVVVTGFSPQLQWASPPADQGEARGRLDLEGRYRRLLELAERKAALAREEAALAHEQALVEQQVRAQSRQRTHHLYGAPSSGAAATSRDDGAYAQAHESLGEDARAASFPQRPDNGHGAEDRGGTCSPQDGSIQGSQGGGYPTLRPSEVPDNGHPSDGYTPDSGHPSDGYAPDSGQPSDGYAPAGPRGSPDGSHEHAHRSQLPPIRPHQHPPLPAPQRGLVSGPAFSASQPALSDPGQLPSLELSAGPHGAPDTPFGMASFDPDNLSWLCSEL